MIRAHRCDGTGGIGGPLGQFGDDLCAGCLRELFDWYSGADAPSVQPVPPPPPAQPLIGLRERMIAVQIAEQAIIAEIHAGIAVIREEPTSILSGEVIPGALAGARGAAKAMVDDIIERLDLRKVKR